MELMPSREWLYPDLPESAQLSCAAAKDIFLFIKRDLQPKILKALRLLYSQDDDTPDRFVDLFELELRLRQLSEYLTELSSVIHQEEPLLDAQHMPVKLHCLEIKNRLYASCEAEMFVCPTSRDFVHGPIAAYYATRLVERLLGPDEWLTEILSIRWKKPIINNLRLVVYDKAYPHSHTTEEVCIEGSFHTNEGRVLLFYGVEIASSPIVNETGYNTYTMNMLIPFHFSPNRINGIFHILLNPIGAAASDSRLDQSKPLIIYTLLDVLSLGILNIRKQENGENRCLLGSVKHFRLKKGFDTQVKSGLDLEIRTYDHRIRWSQHSGLCIVPFEFRFVPYQEAFGIGMLAEAKSLNQMIRYLHSQH